MLFVSVLGKILGSLPHGKVFFVFAIAAYSHSALVGKRYSFPVFSEYHWQYAIASRNVI